MILNLLRCGCRVNIRTEVLETVTIAYQGEVSHRDSHGGGGNDW